MSLELISFSLFVLLLLLSLILIVNNVFVCLSSSALMSFCKILYKTDVVMYSKYLFNARYESTLSYVVCLLITHYFGCIVPVPCDLTPVNGPLPWP